MIYQTKDVAIAAALAESAPGDQVVIHIEACGSRGATDNESAERFCTCEPMTLTAGARA